MSSRSVDETRRDFLLRLARGASLAAPVVLTLRAEEARAQGKGSQTSQQTASTSSSVGGLSPATTTAVQSEPSITEQLAPWDPAASTQPAPWERPPPTSSGG